MPNKNTLLRADDADTLLSVWTQHFADARGIRQILIKGRALAFHGLRTPRASADVDVLVDPARFDEYCTLLLDDGWEEIPATFVKAFFTLHSRTFFRAGWPNTLDVHRFFPGFLARSDHVFEALWERRMTMRVGYRDCVIGDHATNTLVLALHSLRSSSKNQRHVLELENLIARGVSAVQGLEIAELAERTGSAAPLAGVLEKLGLPVQVDPATYRSDAYQDWAQIVAEANGAPANWFRVIRRTPPRQIPLVIYRAVWPSKEDLVRAHPELAGRSGLLVIPRLKRIAVGVSNALVRRP